ncbi:integrator complex subunit 8 [Lycorma delicatula]|uniref:integrator complex subunit 8 n=1 Tax=Lycorma delicatula TaxID=130591 RepID=UPI003F50DF2D
MDVDLLRPGTVPISRDTLLWFEFLLDPTRGGLLEKHLNKPNSDPSGPDLIIKFLTIPDQTKEPETINVDGNGQDPNKLNTDSIKSSSNKLSSKNLSLKVLALKVAAFYKWDLEILEQKIPLPLQMTLLCDLLNLVGVSSKNATPHCSIDYTSEPDHVLFAVSLYHRWAVRAVMNSSQNTKQSRFNTLHGMQDNQYVALCVAEELMSRLEEDAERSVEVLSKIVEAGNTRGQLSQGVPSSSTFVPLSEDETELQIDWSSSSSYISINEFHCQLLFDVSVYQFFRESYQAASQNFIMCHSRYQDWKTEESIKHSQQSDSVSDKTKAKSFFCHVKEDILNGYIAASKSLTLETPGLTLTQRFLVSCRDSYSKLLEILQEDNIHREIPQAYRDCLELEIAAGLSSGTLTTTRDLLLQIQTLNIIRRVLDSNTTNYNYTAKLSQGRKAVEILTWALQKTSRAPQDVVRLQSFMCDLVLSCPSSLAAEICSVQKLNHLIPQELKDEVFNKQKAEEQQKSSFPDEYLETTYQSSIIEEIKNPQLENYATERALLSTYNPVKIRELICRTATTSSMRNISRLNLKWELPVPIQNLLMNLPPGFLQQYLYVLLAKAKELESDKNFDMARRLFDIIQLELKSSSAPNNISFKLRQLVDWEILLLDINQFHSNWPIRTLDCQQLGMKCIMVLQTVDGPVVPRIEITEQAAVTLLNLADWDSVSSGPLLDKRLPACELVTAIGFACQDIIKFKGNKKVTRDAWDLVLPTFLNSSGSGIKRMSSGAGNAPAASSSSTSALTLPILTKVFLSLRDLTALTVSISLLARIHNVLRDDQYSLELITDHTALWPGVVSNANSYNMRPVTELLSQMLTQAIQFYPNSVTWLKLFGDLYFVMQHYATSLKYYVMAAIQNTDYLTKPLTMEDHVYRRMIKSCMQLQCFAQAGILCQFLDDVDYNTAFKAFSEQVSWDAMDSYYDCIWDVNILEYLIQLHHKRNEVHRKQKAIKVIGLLELNANNNEEIKREAANIRKSRFMRAMANQYVGLCALSNAKQLISPNHCE